MVSLYHSERQFPTRLKSLDSGYDRDTWVDPENPARRLDTKTRNLQYGSFVN